MSDRAVRSRPAGGVLDRRAARPTRRSELMAVAAELFAERGFGGVTVDDIGAAAGVSGPALYHHFQSKEALLGEMLVAISESLLERAEKIAADADRPEDVLDGLIAMHCEFAVDHPELITVQARDLVHAPDADRRRIRRLQAAYVRIWIDATAAVHAGRDRRVVRAAVHAAIGLINSTPFSATLRRDEMLALLAPMASAALVAVPRHTSTI